LTHPPLLSFQHGSIGLEQDGGYHKPSELNILKYCTVPISQSNIVENDDAL